MAGVVVIPIDGSVFSAQALPYSLELAHTLAADLLLVRVVPYDNAHLPALMPGERRAQLIAEADAELEEIGAEIQSSDPSLGVTSVVLEGDPPWAMLGLLEARSDVQAIVLATHGRGGAHFWAGGRMAEHLLRASPVPVLLVRDGMPMIQRRQRIERALVPLDGSSFGASALEAAMGFARGGAELLLLSVLPRLTPEDRAQVRSGALPGWMVGHLPIRADELRPYVEARARELSAAGLPVRPVVRSGLPALEIVRAAVEERADLIVMATHGHSGLRRFWMGSVALQVMRAAPVPVLLVRQGAVHTIPNTLAHAVGQHS